MKAAMYIIPWRMPKILKGAGSILQLPEFLKKKKLSNILIVTGPNIHKRGLLDELEKGLQQENLSYYIFDDISHSSANFSCTALPYALITCVSNIAIANP